MSLIINLESLCILVVFAGYQSFPKVQPDVTLSGNEVVTIFVFPLIVMSVLFFVVLRENQTRLLLVMPSCYLSSVPDL